MKRHDPIRIVPAVLAYVLLLLLVETDMVQSRSKKRGGCANTVGSRPQPQIRVHRVMLEARLPLYTYKLLLRGTTAAPKLVGSAVLGLETPHPEIYDVGAQLGISNVSSAGTNEEGVA